MARPRPFVRSALVLGFAAALTRLVGCVGEDAATRPAGTLPDGQGCALGSESCGCTSGGACDPGLRCLSERCVRVGEDGAILTDTGATDAPVGDASLDTTDVREVGIEGGTVLVTVSMSGAKEKPTPSNSPGTGGPSSLVLDTVSGQLKGTIPFANLLGFTTAAHIHQASCSAAGPVLYTLAVQTGVKSGSINVDVTLTPADVMLVQKREFYVNLHTEQFTGGEIRGQLVAAGDVDCP